MKTHSGEVIAERDNLRVIQCRECGFAHLDRLPPGVELSQYYMAEFWQKDKAGELALYEDRREWWSMVHSDWLSRLEVATLGRTLLDVGCGYGFFLKTAIERKWHITGFEPSQTAADYATKLCGNGIWCGDWQHRDRSYDAPEKFDAISALWLIEHLPDPEAFLLWCHQHLYSGGVLLVVCPNEWTAAQYSADAIVHKRGWWIHPTHLNYFNMATLGNLLGRTGFKIVEWLATFPIEKYIMNGEENYVDHPEMGPEIHRIIERSEMHMQPDKRLTLYHDLARMSGGRDIVAIAQMN